jgi:hypothetical protein
MRKLLTILNAMLRDKKPFKQPLRLDKEHSCSQEDIDCDVRVSISCVAARPGRREIPPLCRVRRWLRTHEPAKRSG